MAYISLNAYLQMLQEFAIDNILPINQMSRIFPTGWFTASFCPYRLHLSRSKFPKLLDRLWQTIGMATPPDLTPYDFWLWGKIKDRMYSKKSQTLKYRIKGVISNIPHEMCVKALNCTVDRWFLCINHAGGDCSVNSE